jgi:ribulose-5-phosphate 4-epimerase/fuculose-1-phosphate aldolase
VHVSARDPKRGGLWMKEASFGFEELTAEHVILVGFDGKVIAGEHPRQIEWPIHTEVLRARPELGSVVHTHPPHSTAIAASGQPLGPGLARGHDVRPPGVPRFTQTGKLITTTGLGGDVSKTVADHHALFLVNHRIGTAGPQRAVIRAAVLEKAAHQHRSRTRSAARGAGPTTRSPCASAPPCGPNGSAPRCGIAWAAAGRAADRPCPGTNAAPSGRATGPYGGCAPAQP